MHDLALKTAAVQFVYNFLASLLDRTLIPAVPNNTPAAKIPVFFPSTFFKPFKMRLAIVAKIVGYLRRVFANFSAFFFLAVEYSQRIFFVTNLAGFAKTVVIVL